MNEVEALSQFINITDDGIRCQKCGSKLLQNSGPYKDKYFDANWGVPQIQVCETCFDNDIKSRWGYF